MKIRWQKWGERAHAEIQIDGKLRGGCCYRAVGLPDAH